MAIITNATEFPDSSVRVLPQDYGYVVTWAEEINKPYLLNIADKSEIKIASRF